MDFEASCDFTPVGIYCYRVFFGTYLLNNFFYFLKKDLIRSTNKISKTSTI